MKRTFTVYTAYCCLLVVLLTSCNAYRHGYTWRKAAGKYNLVTGNLDNFGDQRIKYVKGFHRTYAFNCMLETKGTPGFIYEYRSADKCRGIRLYYPALDSVFTFEEPKRGKLRLVLKEARIMEENEKAMHQQLLSKR